MNRYPYFYHLTVNDCVTGETAQNNVMSQAPVTRLDEVESFFASSSFVTRSQSLEGNKITRCLLDGTDVA